MMGSRFWFDHEESDVFHAVMDTVEAIENDQHGLQDDYRSFSSLYRGRLVNSFRPGEWNVFTGEDWDRYNECRWNVVRAVVDTLVAKVTLEKPSIRFQTINGPEILQRKARLLEQFTLGALRDARAWKSARTALRHAVVYGTGIVKTWAQDGRVHTRAVHPSRFIVDDNAALDTEPLSKFERYTISRPALMEIIQADTLLTPAEKKKRLAVVERTQSASSGGASGGGQFRDLVEVVEAWREPIGGRAGRHSIVTKDGVLFDNKQLFQPSMYAAIRFGEDLQGWHGISLVEQIEGCQVEINRTLEKIRGNLEHLAPAFIFRDSQAEINDADIMDNEHYKVITALKPPQVITPPIIHPQVIQYLESQWARAFELSGISQLNATSSNPALPRLDSASALRFFQDIQTERFSEVAGGYNDMIENMSIHLLRAGKTLQGKWRVKGLAKGFIKQIDWKDVSLEDDQFHLSVSTISSLPRHPAGRRAEVQELARAGLITREQALQLLDWPDLEKFNSLANAATEDLENTFEHILSTGDYIKPLPFQNLQMGIQKGTSYYLRARMDGADKENLDLVARWLQEASELLNPAPEPDAAIGIAPQADPLAGLPAGAGAAQQLAQAAATLPA